MKKLDKLILKSFIGPLILTFCVSVFILLIQYMLKYFDDLVGKDLGFSVFSELLLYFSINMTPIALPLAILIASIMTYGNLGEHFELTAIKGSGISLTRTLVPTGVLVVLISFGAYYSNNNIVPAANLRAYSLLYDIKQQKPSLDIQEGQFYHGLPNYSIKVKMKHKDGIAMSDVIIYDHKGSTQGNKKMITADSCRMYTIANERYLMMELFNGNHYQEGDQKNRKSKSGIETFSRTEFSNMKMVFSLASFDLDRTDMDLFAGNKLMKNIERLTEDIDSMVNSILTAKYQIFKATSHQFRYHFNTELDIPESLELAQKKVRRKQHFTDSLKMAKEDSAMNLTNKPDTVVYNEDKSKHILENKAIAYEKESKQISETEGLKSKEKTENLSKATQQNSSIKALSLSDKKKFSKIKNIEKINTKPPSSGALTQLKKIKDSKEKKDNTKAPIKEKVKTVKKPNIIKPAKKPPIKSYAAKSDTLYIENDSLLAIFKLKIDSVYDVFSTKKKAYTRATGAARTIRSNLSQKKQSIANYEMHSNAHKLEKNKKYSQAVACFIMFLIGAPLGAIIKKGGLGMPVVVSVFFFIIFYVMTVIADKWAKASVMDGYQAAWVADLVLLPFGILFLYQARKDAKLFDADFYSVWWQNLQLWWKKKKSRQIQSIND
jgi:lipopolysaccharide export system permease protein